MRLTFNAINKDIFDSLKNGIKKVETRAATIRYKNLKAGDTVTFSCGDESFTKKLTKMNHFTSIDSLLVKYKPMEINPKLTTKEEIIAMYHSFPGYKEKINSSGIVAIELE